MDKSELAKLGYDTDDLAAGIDYVPDLDGAGDDVVSDFVERAQRQATELNSLGGVTILGGSRERRDGISLALDDGVELMAAVERFGDEEQRLQACKLISTGQISD